MARVIHHESEILGNSNSHADFHPSRAMAGLACYVAVRASRRPINGEAKPVKSKIESRVIVCTVRMSASRLAAKQLDTIDFHDLFA
jgi:hypothetical protein